ncbi:glutamate-ammonia-ligase adenylyltransferase [Actinobaculum suis]|uniref:Bifunctional [glutamine synthetase] adenylyltransferase/[glutamine synthetase]-adenylyl-L-tyrosine phosphorylase n=1 Tax=Actinobaculum suis TaxID=1657 RepID=A0A1G7BQ40_9ACTO|nr:bifunctional [glutamine synthetase] adenylyltransferase/[glutamine synthetase]-adenylyl-L-tyrosine phosphorylase [Actinobaculum suis]MDY5153807.1 bifunctional [glutamine synthetase] adenylyltransferase/[glutamine synthetase]-adenylyl-L-tyrosine phosphorylase [Actinobaculum suis]SDE29189.1 glutamate-ammonia-ligase adenylyltransferase [Actinobaculum suis]
MNRNSISSRLRAAGFTDPQRAARICASLDLEALRLSPEDFAICADPDRALLALARLEKTLPAAVPQMFAPAGGTGGVSGDTGVGGGAAGVGGGAAGAGGNDGNGRGGGGAAGAAGAGGSAEGGGAGDIDGAGIASEAGGQAARQRLLAVLGLSTALADHLARHPEAAQILLAAPRWETSGQAGTAWEVERLAENLGLPETSGPAAGGAQFSANLARSSGAAIASLRARYCSEILAIAGADLTAPAAVEVMPQVAGQISDVVTRTLEAGLQLAQAETPGAEKTRLAVIAMGKTGGRELNYASDVDVIYVAEPRGQVSEAEALHIAEKIVVRLAQIVSQAGAEPALWALDTNLRPEGGRGPLVRTLASHLDYYRTWGQSWEFQALLKARFAAGDRELGAAYVEETRPLVWQASQRPDFVEDARAMRQRVEETIASQDQELHVKLGRGGLRDVEFTVQLLQLVHGRADPNIRQSNTLAALQALAEGTYISRQDAASLDRLYRWERCLEHRLQLQRLRRAPLFPTQEGELRRIARAMGEMSGPALAEKFRNVRRQVRGLHENIFYRPLLPAAARLSESDISLERGAAFDRLSALGYRDPRGALGHIAALTRGYSRTARIARQLLPVMLGWFASGPDPDAGLRAFRILSEKMGSTSWYMRELRDGGPVAQRLCTALARSEFLAREIPELPESVAWLARDEHLQPRTFSQLTAELEAMVERRETALEIALAGRFLRRRERLRIGLATALGVIDTETARRALSQATHIAIQAALQAALREAGASPAQARAGCIRTRRKYNAPRGEDTGMNTGPGGETLEICVIAMGSLGGEESGFASDADALFVYRYGPETHGADPEKRAAGTEESTSSVETDVETNVESSVETKVETSVDPQQLASRTLHFLREGSAEPPVEIDTDLRPEGKQGPLARSLASSASYYQEWAQTWEKQALLRARPIAGSQTLGLAFREVIDPYRYPAAPGFSAREVTEVRRMKLRIEKERIPGGGRATHHVKLGPGGLADIEWTAQLLQLQYAGQVPGLRTTSTVEALRAAAQAGILRAPDASELIEAWQRAGAVRDARFLARGTGGPKADYLATDPAELARVGAILGEPGREVNEHYLKAARRARQIVERVFYGQEPHSPTALA